MWFGSDARRCRQRDKQDDGIASGKGFGPRRLHHAPIGPRTCYRVQRFASCICPKYMGLFEQRWVISLSDCDSVCTWSPLSDWKHRSKHRCRTVVFLRGLKKESHRKQTWQDKPGADRERGSKTKLMNSTDTVLKCLHASNEPGRCDIHPCETNSNDSRNYLKWHKHLSQRPLLSWCSAQSLQSIACAGRLFKIQNCVQNRRQSPAFRAGDSNRSLWSRVQNRCVQTSRMKKCQRMLDKKLACLRREE